MTEDSLTRLKAIDLTTLTDIVRQDQRSPSFNITECSVRPLSHKGISNPYGLFLFSGQGKDERSSNSWSVVLKIIEHPEQEPEPNSLNYWRREFLAVQSGLLADLPGPVHPPRFYLIHEDGDGIWLWMEHVQEPVNKQWTIEEYAFAAHQLGRWNGYYLTGGLMPDYPWLAVDHVKSWLGPEDQAEIWQEPHVIMNFSEIERARHIRLVKDKDSFITTLQRLPQIFSHFDYQRRNLFIRENNVLSKQLIAIDWACCGSGAIGSDLCSLICTSIMLFEFPFSSFTELETAACRAYIEGLRDVGWAGPADLARIGYLVYSSLWFTLIFPSGIAWWSADEQKAFAMQQFGMAGDDLAKAYAMMFSAFLDRVDEARQLINDLDHYLNAE